MAPVTPKRRASTRRKDPPTFLKHIVEAANIPFAIASEGAKLDAARAAMALGAALGLLLAVVPAIVLVDDGHPILATIVLGAMAVVGALVPRLPDMVRPRTAAQGDTAPVQTGKMRIAMPRVRTSLLERSEAEAEAEAQAEAEAEVIPHEPSDGPRRGTLARSRKPQLGREKVG